MAHGIPRPLLAWLLIGAATTCLEIATIALGRHPTRAWSGLRVWVRVTWPWTWVLLPANLLAGPVALGMLLYFWTHRQEEP